MFNFSFLNLTLIYLTILFLLLFFFQFLKFIVFSYTCCALLCFSFKTIRTSKDFVNFNIYFIFPFYYFYYFSWQYNLIFRYISKWSLFYKQFSIFSKFLIIVFAFFILICLLIILNMKNFKYLNILLFYFQLYRYVFISIFK